MAAGRHLEFGPTGKGATGSAVPENPTLEPKTKWIGRRVAEIWPFDVFPDGRRPPSYEFGPTGNGAAGSAVPENPTLEPNTKSIG